MSYVIIFWLILLGALLALLLPPCWMARAERPESRADRLADPAPMPGELPAAGYLDAPGWVHAPRPGWTPYDTPFPAVPPLLNETRALADRVTRDVAAAVSETDWLIEQGERRLPVRRR